MKNAIFGSSQLTNLETINLKIASITDDLSLLSASFTDTLVECTDRALKLGYLAINASMLYDCLYHYYQNMDTSNPYYAPYDGNLDKLKNVMLMCIDLMMSTETYYESIFDIPSSSYLKYKHGYWASNFPKSPHPVYPGFSLIQYRLSMYGALGLTSLLLSATDSSIEDEMLDIVSYVDSMLVTSEIPLTFSDEYKKAGMLAFHTSNSGAYFESLGYLGFLMEHLSPYFVARKRLSVSSVNYFDNPYIVSWISDLTQKVSPTGEDWVYNDSKYLRKINACVAYAFYQNTTDSQNINNKCSWYIRTKRDWLTTTPLLLQGWMDSYFYVLYFSDPYKFPKMLNCNDIPNVISEGSWSNSEFSVLTALPDVPAVDSAVYRSKPTMQITHENSFSGYHSQADQSSYSFFYNGKQFLIDPGYYRTGWKDGRTFCRSPYAHNMLIVNPSETVQSSLLSNLGGDYRPLSAFRYYEKETVTPEEMVEDPCFRKYFQKSPDLDILSLKLGYRNSDNNSLPLEQQVEIASLSRSFVRDKDLFVIYDDVTSHDEENFYDYWNLLHFGVSPGSAADVVLDNNVFSVKQSSGSGFDYLEIACGSFSPYYSGTVKETSVNLLNFPNCQYLPYNSHIRGKQVATAAQNPKFITVLAPRSGGTPRVLDSVTVIDSIYCTAVTSISSSVPATETLTLIGCTDGGENAIDILDIAIETDGKMFMATKYRDSPSISLDRSIVLLNGEYLRVDGTDLLHLYNSDIKGITASYMLNKLDVVCHDTSISHPRFRVYRSGADPEQFTAVMLTSVEPMYPVPPSGDPNHRFYSTDILQSLAYDDQYFYVNYAWADLEAAGLINDNLVIAKGTIPQTELYTDLNIQGDIEITGNITIAGGASMEIGPNSSVLVSEGVTIHNRGLLSIDGGNSRSITMDTSDQQWLGILTYQNAYLFCNNAIIKRAKIGIQARGAVTITNSEIQNCDQGISIDMRTPFIIVNNRILQNNTGIVIMNNYIASSLGYISDNEITQNDIAMLIYNSNTMILKNDIHNNASVGLIMLRSSEPIVRECNISYTEINGSSGPEIRLLNDSYPILDENSNDINADGIGYSLYYQSSGGLEPMKATNNYWGTTDARQIRASIYPPSWRVDFEPFSSEPNTFFIHSGDNLFKQALAAEESGDQALARQLYTSIATNEPDSLYALQSLGRLNSIYAGYPDLLNDLRGIYDAYMVACSDSVLIKGAQAKYAILDRLDGLYTEAIQGYEDLLLLSTTEMDSLLCLLDIAYTMQDMYYDDSGKAAHSTMSYQSNGISISTLKDAKHTVEQLWGKILAKSEDESIYNAPVPTKLEVSNYPNPFNPSTTIAFSVPEAGKVRLTVYNIRGQRVRDLIDDNMMRGFHKVIWDGKDNGNSSVSSGLYFVRIDTGSNAVVKKVMMLK
ncbi:MAG: heparinase II/III family protein [Candidatus Cloacimonetes bacterium]|nr:heparinase II/III family protein [Candidatus Cloacimonadota bacterium]MDY0171817.1 heparinase II/III family protein [Candidatus Cloacimonadaceae bacterium]